MSDYLDALEGRAEWDPVAAALAEADRQRFLPVPVERLAAPAPVVVHQPEPLPAPQRRGLDPWVVRPLALGGCVALCGLGVDLAGMGIRAAGPYLWGLAAVLGALAALVALIKSKSAPVSGGTNVTIQDSRHVKVRL
ncbi:hypothetical protein [Streptacidiphilus carbonis]|uniref:hypothetical protein n=1 Tax=Streptacidiphilus carbonis TaxID=105422 RepID=UPI0005AB2D94|nr:hypothetical protein [Streptacidiphilus carbonis]